jgi:signal transduction histidine kinase
MKENKTKLQGQIILAVVFVMFTVVAFAIPFEQNGVFWLAYLFTAVAIGAQIYVFKIAFEKGKKVKSALYGFPIIRIGLIYLVIQLVAGLIFMAVAAIAPVWLAILVFVLILGVAAIGLISTEIMRDEVERQDTVLKKDTTVMRELQSRAALFVGQCGDSEAKAELKKLSEAMRYSDPVSHESLSSIESELACAIDELESAVARGESEIVIAQCRKASNLLESRNRLCKLNK